MTVIPQEKIDALLARFETIESDLANVVKLDREEYARLSREHAELSPVIDVAREFLRVNDEVMELMVLAEDESSEKELRALAKEEIVAMR